MNVQIVSTGVVVRRFSILWALLSTIEECETLQITLPPSYQTSLNNRKYKIVSTNADLRHVVQSRKPLCSSITNSNNDAIISIPCNDTSSSYETHPYGVEVKEKSVSEVVIDDMRTETFLEPEVKVKDENRLFKAITDKVGRVNEERLVFPELSNGEVPRMFSNIKYEKS